MSVFLKNNKIYFIILVTVIALGIYLRTNALLFNSSLWHDEASLAMNIIERNFIELLNPLDYNQKPPILFPIIIKFFTLIFGIKEFGFHVFPFICSIFSIGFFFVLSLKLLNNKFSIIMANMLFATNFQLIYFSQELKQYSSDVLCSILATLLVLKMLKTKLNLKNILLFFGFGFFCSLFSYPTLFVLSSLFILKPFFMKKEELKFFIPLIVFSVIGGVLYYELMLKSIRNSEINNFAYYWAAGFVNSDFSNTFLIIRNAFNFIFEPNNFALLGIILFGMGMICILLKQNYKALIILTVLIIAIIVSSLKIYPFAMRTVLYFIPFAIIGICLSFDLITHNKKMFAAILLTVGLLYFHNYLTLEYINKLINKYSYDIQGSKETLEFIIKNHTSDKYIIKSHVSRSDYNYYTLYYGFYPKKFGEIRPYANKESLYYTYLSYFPNGNTYMIYFPFGVKNINALENWCKNHGKITDKLIVRNSVAIIFKKLN